MFSDSLYQNNPLSQKGLNTVKRSFSSNSAMTLIILYGATLLITIISFIMVFSNLDTVLSQISSLFSNKSYSSSYYYQLANQIRGTFTIVGIIILAIYSLPFIGLLTAFIKSKNPSETSNPNGGLTVLFVSGIINTIISSVIIIYLIVLFFNSINSVSKYSNYNYYGYNAAVSAAQTGLTIGFMLVIAVYIVVLLFCIGMTLSAYSAKRSIRDNVLYTKGWKLTRVSSIIMACLIGLCALLSIGAIAQQFFSWLNVALYTAIYITLAVFITGHLRNIFISNNGGFVPPVNNTNTYYNSTNLNTYPQQPTANQNYYAQPQQPTANQNYYAQPQQPTTNQNYYAQPQQPTANQNYYAQPQQQTAKPSYYVNQPQQPSANQNQNYYSNTSANKQQPVNLNKADTPVVSNAVTEQPVNLVKPAPSNEQPIVCPSCKHTLVGKSLFCPNCGNKL